MNIRGRHVTLRAIEREDLELLRAMFNDEAIEQLVVGWAFPLARQQQEDWYDQNIGNTSSLRLIIETDAGDAVGVIMLKDIDWKNRRATHGIKLARASDRARGIGTDALRAIMRYAFNELQLHRLDSVILEGNEPSYHLHCAKCGWTPEGRQRQAIYKNGRYHDLLLIGILADDYRRIAAAERWWDEPPAES